MEVIDLDTLSRTESTDKQLFERLADDIALQGYSVQESGVPIELAEALWFHLQSMPKSLFDPAGIGRQTAHQQNEFVRRDEICWINGESEAGKSWLAWTSELQTFLNRRLLLGLFSFESHFAHYAPGDFYKRHVDAFKGEANRVLSIVLYLNPGWLADDGGEFVLYQDQSDLSGRKFLPRFATLVAFLSEDFPHEVLPANRDRYSIAGWFRLNTSRPNRVDPPR